MIVAIPSHNREKLLGKTIDLLLTRGLLPSDIYIFSSSESIGRYTELFKNRVNKIYETPNEPRGGICDARNMISRTFPEGTKIVEMDDDIRGIYKFLEGNETTEVPDLKQFFNECFTLCGNGLWGLNPNMNAFFSDKQDKFGLYSIIASTCGYVNDHSVILETPEKEDFDRAIQYYNLNKPILKRSGYAIKTKYWTEKGGIQDRYNFEMRKMKQRLSAEMLLNKYPDLLYLRTRKNGIVDVRFRRNKKINDKYNNINNNE